MARSKTAETLRAMLGDTGYRALELLADVSVPMSGRMVASALHVAPTTATSVLGKLRDAGFAQATREGRADRWRLNTNNPVLQTWLQEGKDAPSPAPRQQARVVILTALPEEYQAVVAHLDSPQPDRAGMTHYERGGFHGTHIDWTVYIAEVGMGNVSASTELAKAQSKFDPAIVLFVGVAGSVKPDDLCRGDVVVASEAYNIHAGKHAIDDGGRAVNLGRPVGHPAPYGLVQLARTVRRGDWTSEVKLLEPGDVLNDKSTTPNVEIKGIAAGEVVHANVNSALMDLIRSRFNNVAAVDMESYGIYEAAHRLDLPALAVRGISDSVGDKAADQDKEWQPVAAKHAAGFAFALLRAAEAEDLGVRPIPSPAPTAPSGIEPIDESLFRLPPAVAVAYESAARAFPDPATALVKELADQGEQWEPWLDRFRRRQPAPFAQEDSGSMWLIAAAYADSHHHPDTSWLYERAGDHTSESASRSLLYARAGLVAAREGDRDRGKSLIARARQLRPEAELLWDFHSQALEDNGASLVGIARRLMEPLDLIFLQPALSAATSAASEPDVLTDYLDDLAAESPESFEQLRYFIAYVTGIALQVTNQLPSAQLLFETLNRGMPSTRPRTPGNAIRGSLVGPRTATVITQLAKTISARVAAPGGTEPGLDIDKALSTALDLALTARDRILDWHGPTSEALQIAALARSRAGDPRGALRLLLPSPRGTARLEEAKAQPVIALAAELAAATQDSDLSFELAKQIEDPVERHIATGLGYLNRADCRAEAATEFRKALHHEHAVGRPDYQIRALLALALVEQPTDAEIQLVERLDPQLADLIRAQALVTAGRGLQAQIIARRYPASEAAVQIRVATLLDDGKISQAVAALEAFGRQHHDERFLVQAATLALQNNQNDEAERLAALFAGSNDQHRRRIAHEILIETATRSKEWDRVLLETGRLINDPVVAEHDPDRDEHLIAYRWARAQAHYQLRQIDEAYQVIREEPSLQPANENQARFVVSVLHFLAPSIQDQGSTTHPSGSPTQAEVLTQVTSIAQAFPDDEELVAAAVMTSLRLPVKEPLDPAQLAKARQLQEHFFERFPESKLIERITIDDTLTDITEMLRTRLAAGAEEAIRMRRAAWAGRVPLSVYTTAIRRSYAEGLIRDALDCYVIVNPNPDINLAEIAAAADALNDSVVVDTSTLYLAQTIIGNLADLRSRFERLLLASPQRDDVLAARSSVQLTSPFSMGWDPYTNRPTMHQTDATTTQRWVTEADRLALALDWCEIVPDPPDNHEDDERVWSSSIRLAKDRGLFLLADDAALRATARNEGVRAFSSLSVLHAVVSRGEEPQSAIDTAYQRLMTIRGAELPLLDKIRDIASSDEWSPSSYAAFLLARPITWQPIDQGLRLYMSLIRDMPSDDPGNLAVWCSTAMYGACQTVAPAAVPAVASSLGAWTVLTTRNGDLLASLMATCPPVLRQFAGDVDFLGVVVLQIIANLRQVFPADHVAAAFVPLLRGLNEADRSRSMQLFLTAP